MGKLARYHFAVSGEVRAGAEALLPPTQPFTDSVFQGQTVAATWKL